MFYLILLAHWFCDFILQTRQQAERKSSDWWVLGEHIIYYTFGIFLLLWPFVGFPYAMAYAIVNGITHFFIDAVTSRVSSYAYKNQKMKLFWSTIGFDQFLHVSILYWSMFLLL